MKNLYKAIKAKILAEVPEVMHIAVWNNQLSKLNDGSDWGFPFPCVFVELLTPNEITQLGNGVQMYDPLTVRIHIGHEFYNGANQDENLDVFDLRANVFTALQKFEPDRAGQFIRTNETQDFDHTNVYHYIQDYQTNLIDNQQAEPLNGVAARGPFTVSITHTLS